MSGLGTIVNVAAIIIGGLIGLLFKGGLKERFRSILMEACGLAVIFIGAAGAFEMIFTIQDNKIKSGSTMLIVISLVIGGLIGELINIEKGLNTAGKKLKKLVKADGDNKFVDGFVTASLVFCIGAMAICGPIVAASRLRLYCRRCPISIIACLRKYNNSPLAVIMTLLTLRNL